MCLWKPNPTGVYAQDWPVHPHTVPDWDSVSSSMSSPTLQCIPSPLIRSCWCWLANQCFEPKVGIQESCSQTSLKCFLLFLCPVWQLYNLIINGCENLGVSAAGPLSCGAGVYFGVSSWLGSAFGNWWSWTLIHTSRPSCIWMSWAPGDCKLARAGSSTPLFIVPVEIKWEKLMW